MHLDISLEDINTNVTFSIIVPGLSRSQVQSLGNLGVALCSIGQLHQAMLLAKLNSQGFFDRFSKRIKDVILVDGPTEHFGLWVHHERSLQLRNKEIQLHHGFLSKARYC